MFWYHSGNDLIRIWQLVGGGLVGCGIVFRQCVGKGLGFGKVSGEGLVHV